MGGNKLEGWRKAALAQVYGYIWHRFWRDLGTDLIIIGMKQLSEMI